MKTINTVACTDIEIKKSKFISFSYPIHSLEMAEHLLCNLRKEYDNATHICFAYILNYPAIEKCSDDGEPSGTAGVPILNILKKMNLKNILLVVVRYYGGIKLGAGGLVRAYTRACAETLKNCCIVEQRKCCVCEVMLEFSESDSFLNYIHKNSFKLISINYSEQVNYCVAVENVEDLKRYLNSLNSKYVLNEIETKYL